MRKIIFLLLLSIATYGQTSNGTETKQNAFRSLNPQTVTNPAFLGTMGSDGTMGKTDASLWAKKTDLPNQYAKIVYVNSTNPNSATIFSEEIPPIVNNDLLKQNADYLYIGNDATTWIYNGTNYATKTASRDISNFWIKGTSLDAGASKSGKIYRTGSVESSKFITSDKTDDDIVLGTGNTISKTDLIDYLEFNTASALPVTGVAGKIYLTKDDNKLYRWNGTVYSLVSDTDLTAVNNALDKKKDNNETIEIIPTGQDSYTLNQLNINKLTQFDNLNLYSEIDIIIPTNAIIAFPIGTKKTFFNNGMAGGNANTEITFSGSGVTIQGIRNNFRVNEFFSILKIAENTWTTQTYYSIPEFLVYNNNLKQLTNYGKGGISSNTSFGINFNNNTTGVSNSAFGLNALLANATNSNNSAFGDSSSMYSIGNNNSSFGVLSNYLGIGSNNSSFGNSSLQSFTGISNTAVGVNSSERIGISSYNSSFGVNSLREAVGDNNLAIGYESGWYLNNDIYNRMTLCNNSVFLGAYTQGLANNQTNQIVIGHNAVGAGSNTATIGNGLITKTVINGLITAPTTTNAIIDADLTGKAIVTKEWVLANSSGGSSATNLSTTANATTVTVVSDTGNDAIIPAVDNTNAGIVTVAQKANWDSKQDALGFTPYNSTNPSQFQTLSQVNAIADAKVSDNVLDANNDNSNYAPSQKSVRQALANKLGVVTGFSANRNVITDSGGNIVAGSVLTANRALTTNASGIPAVSAVTSTQIGYLNTLTSNVQSQIDAKVSNANATFKGTYTTSATAQTTFTVNVGMAMPNTTYNVIPVARNMLSAVTFFVTNKTTTTFDIVVAAGLTGSVSYDFVVTP